MGGEKIAQLDDRGIVQVSGGEAAEFLQRLITTEVDDLAPGETRLGALLTPQGKILFDFLVARDGDTYVFDLHRDSVGDFAKRMTFYRLRAKVDIANRSDDKSVFAVWRSDGDDLPNGLVLADRRAEGLGYRVITDASEPLAANATPADYHAHRIALTVPEGGRDYGYGELFPHDVAMDVLGGVDFEKGCYVGQEVVSRMEHRGTARRRVVRVCGDRPIPAECTLTAGGKTIGQVGSVAGTQGIAIARLDRIKAALSAGTPIAADDVPVTIDLPAWADYDWPNPAAADA